MHIVLRFIQEDTINMSKCKHRALIQRSGVIEINEQVVDLTVLGEKPGFVPPKACPGVYICCELPCN